MDTPDEKSFVIEGKLYLIRSGHVELDNNILIVYNPRGKWSTSEKEGRLKLRAFSYLPLVYYILKGFELKELYDPDKKEITEIGRALFTNFEPENVDLSEVVNLEIMTIEKGRTFRVEYDAGREVVKVLKDINRSMTLLDNDTGEAVKGVFTAKDWVVVS